MTPDIPEYPPLKKPEDEKPPKVLKWDKPGTLSKPKSNFRPLHVKSRVRGKIRRKRDKRFVQFY